MVSSSVLEHGEGFIRFSSIDKDGDLLTINVWPNGQAIATLNEDSAIILDKEALLKLRAMLNSRFPFGE